MTTQHVTTPDIPQVSKTEKVTTTVTSGKEEANASRGTHRLRLWQEHREANDLIQRVLEETDLAVKQEQFNLLVKMLSQHEVAEELVRGTFCISLIIFFVFFFKSLLIR